MSVVHDIRQMFMSFATRDKHLRQFASFEGVRSSIEPPIALPVKAGPIWPESIFLSGIVGRVLPRHCICFIAHLIFEPPVAGLAWEAELGAFQSDTHFRQTILRAKVVRVILGTQFQNIL